MKQREIYLVPFPFSDFSGRKVRPVVIISCDRFNDISDDVIVCGITSNVSKNFYLVKVKNLEEGNLSDICCVKVENILKVSKNLLIKKIGKLKRENFSEILDKLNEIVKE